MKKLYYQFTFVLVSLLLCSAPLLAGDQTQSKKKRAASLSANYFQEYNTPGKLVAVLKVREKKYMALPGARITLINIQETGPVILDTVTTDQNGEAAFRISNYPDIYRDSTGKITCILEYEGDSLTRSSEREVEFRQASFGIVFFQTDSIKYVELSAKEIISDDEMEPIRDMDIQFSIKGLFSLLPFEEATTNEEGKATVEFPVYMPGDTAGVLTIVAHIEDHDDYGTIKTAGSMNWGRVVPLPDEEHRGLGDTDAPLWMVYTLIILLSAVWFHYLYVSWQLMKIKLVGKGVM